MAVPRKRKKLDKTSADLKKRKGKPRAKTRNTGKMASPLSKDPDQKIDKAFEIMDSIDEPSGPAKRKTPVSRNRELEKVSKEVTPKRQGIRFWISLDAVMPEQKKRHGDQRKKQENQSALIDIGLTLPFIWKVPIIGGIAQKVARNIKTIKF
jgi:hypothetical protein